jgi:hypothetical protein
MEYSIKGEIKMEFKIGRQVNVPSIKSTYIVEVKLMHGGSSSYTTHKAKVPEDKTEYLEQIVEILKKIERLPWNDQQEKYPKIPGFAVYFGGEYLGAYDDEPKYDENWPDDVDIDKWDELSDYGFEWKNDITCSDYLARFSSYEIFYYDEHGNKFEVKAI